MTMYPGEFHTVPLDEQEAIERARQSRLRVIAAMQGPEEFEYAARRRKVKPIPGWAYLPFGAGLALTISGLLYVAYAFAGIPGVLGLMAISLGLALVFSLCVIAQDDVPRK